MKKTKLLAVFLVLALAVAVPAAAVVVDFDSINVGGSSGPIPAGYAGFTWDPNFYAVNQDWYNASYGNSVTFPSYPNAAFNAFGVTSVFASKSPFNLVGAYFSFWADNNAFWSEASAGLTVTGYHGMTPVGSAHFALTPGFVYEPLGFNNINYVTFATDEGVTGHWWLMDNLTYNAVPLPPSALLLGSGLLGLLGFRRFRKN